LIQLNFKTLKECFAILLEDQEFSRELIFSA
jgi:hypothetical protein